LAKSAPNSITSEARKSQMPILPLVRPVSRRTSTVYGISIYASNWAWKPLAAPGALYSYGPRYACGTAAKFPCGGGDGAAHSIVVASHGLSPHFSPCLMLQKKFQMNGSWKSAMIHAPHDEMTFRCSTGCANA